MKKLPLFLIYTMLVCCTGNKQTDPLQDVLNVDDSITTIDSVSYYWLQIAEDSARIIAVRDGAIINECLVTGPVYGAVPTNDERFSKRFFFSI